MTVIPTLAHVRVLAAGRIASTLIFGRAGRVSRARRRLLDLARVFDIGGVQRAAQHHPPVIGGVGFLAFKAWSDKRQ